MRTFTGEVVGAAVRPVGGRGGERLAERGSPWTSTRSTPACRTWSSTETWRAARARPRRAACVSTCRTAPATSSPSAASWCSDTSRSSSATPRRRVRSPPRCSAGSWRGWSATGPRYDDAAIAGADPDALAREIATVFAQFERLVSSTREFYTYLAQVLLRYDLDRAEFQAFKTALLDYLQRFVDEVARHMPQHRGGARRRSSPRCRRCGAGERRRSGCVGVGGRGRAPCAGAGPSGLARPARLVRRRAGPATPTPTGVRRLATEAMRALLVNLRRIAAERRPRAEPLRRSARLAGWFDGGGRRHGARAVGVGVRPVLVPPPRLPADDDGDPSPHTASWWRTPSAQVPMALRQLGRTQGSAARRPARGLQRRQASAARRARSVERRRRAALAEIDRHAGRPHGCGSPTRRAAALLDLYARALIGTAAERPVGSGGRGRVGRRSTHRRSGWSVRATPGVRRPCGRARRAGSSWSTSRSTVEVGAAGDVGREATAG